MIPNILYISIILVASSISITIYANEIFISPIYSGCNTTCHGTYAQPYDSLLTVLMINANQSASLTIVLVPSNDANASNDHFLLGAEYTPDNLTYYNYTMNGDWNSNGSNIYLYYKSLTIKPLLCSEYSKNVYSNCINDDQNTRINLKFMNLLIFTENLNFTNIILDGAEDIFTLNALYIVNSSILAINFIQSVNLTQCLYRRIKCCDSYDNLTGYSSIFQDIYCVRPNISCALIINQPIFQKDKALFNLQAISNSSNSVSFTLFQSQISNIWIPYRKSMNTVLSYFIINIKNSTIDNIFFDHGFMFANGVKGEFYFINSKYTDILSKFNNILTARPMNINNTLFEYHDSSFTNTLILHVNNSVFHLGNLFGSIIVQKAQSLTNSIQSIFYMENTQYIGETKYLQNYNVVYSSQYTFFIFGFENATILNTSFFQLIHSVKIKNCETILINNITSKNNIEYYGGSIGITLAGPTKNFYYNVQVTNSIFENNQARKGGSLHIGESGFSINLLLKNLTFINNQATFVGGALNFIGQEIYSNGIIIIKDCYFYNNSASYGGAIFLKTIYLVSGNSINPSRITIQVINSRFLFNQAIFNQQSNSSLNDIYDQSSLPTSGPSGGALYILCYSKCNILFDQNIYNQNKADLCGGALATTESIIKNCKFINNIGTFGGAIIGIQSRYIIDPSSNYTIVNCTFDKNQAIIYNTSGLFSLKNNQISKGGAISIQFDTISNLINVLNCNFSSNSARDKGGAIDGGQYLISSSYFFNNSASSGGALNCLRLNIMSSIFELNHAVNNSKTIYLGQGGAIYLKYDTKFSSINTSIFKDNLADMSGGAIYFTSTIPELNFNTIHFINNKASIYGNNIGAYAIDLVLWKNDSIENIKLEQHDQETIGITYYNHRLKSGRLIQPLNFAILDMYGQIVKEDSSSILTNEPIYSTSINSNISFITNPYAITASHGIYTFDTYSQIFYQPGLSINVSFKSSAINKPPWNHKTIVLNLTFDLCQTGEIFDSNQCIRCSSGFYSLETDPFYNGSCLVCDENAICFGGDLIAPKTGYWRKNSTANLIISCPQKKACLGSSYAEEYMTINGNCSDGYEGNLCGLCSNGYGRFINSFKCFDCSLGWSNYTFIVSIFIMKLLLYAYFIKLAIGYIKISQDNIIETKITFLKIFITYWQLASSITMFQIRWPSQTYQLLDIISSMSIIFADILFLDCNSTSSNYKDFYNFLVKIILDNAISTLLILILVILIYIPYNKLKKIFRIYKIQKMLDYLENKKEKFTTLFIAFLIYYQQPMIQQSLYWFECINIYHNKYPEYYMYRYPQLQCWTEEHIKWGCTIGLIFLIFWGIILPIIVYKMINASKSSSRIGSIKNRLLVIGYNKLSIYWEIYIILMKLIIVIVVTLLPAISPRIPILICIIIFTISLILQRKNNPFYNIMSNKILECSYASLLIIHYCAIYCQAESFYVSDIIISIIVFGCFSGFICFWSLSYCAILYPKNKYFKVLINLAKSKEKEETEIIDIEKNTKFSRRKLQVMEFGVKNRSYSYQ